MRVKCIANNGSNISKKYQEIPSANYALIIDEVYTVYGILLWKNMLYYLTMDNDYSLPYWHPADLFEITDHSFPIEWYFNYFIKNEDLNALWGYLELIFDENHYYELIERQDKAIRIFLKRKNEIDNSY